ncbi:uncharacterized protein ACR2FA_009841 [Aphomia sociella]
MARLEIRPAGWLDRVVTFYKNNFYKDLSKVKPVQIEASIHPAPPGYVDSAAWNYDSVIHLLALIGESETAAPVRRALRRSLRPARRFMSRHESFKAFPKSPQQLLLRYRHRRGLPRGREPPRRGYRLDDDDVILVSNPVEARLPSAQISVTLLRDILEARAAAGRVMPTTTKSTFHWVSISKTAEDATTAGNEGIN